MRLFPGTWFLLLFALITSPPARADEALTLELALARAREHAPAVLSARARIEEARGRLQTASLLLRENPEVDGAAGRPSSGPDRGAELDVGFIQGLELGGKRSARMGIARAELASSMAEAENAQRRALRGVGNQFVVGYALEVETEIVDQFLCQDGCQTGLRIVVSTSIVTPS